MMEAVIFDFGGVITESPFEAFNRLESARGLPKDLVRRINATNPHTNAWARFERSEIGLDGFDLAFADPPYGLGLAARVAGRFLTAPFARRLGVEHAASEAIPSGGDTRRYGDTAVTFYEAP